MIGRGEDSNVSLNGDSSSILYVGISVVVGFSWIYGGSKFSLLNLLLKINRHSKLFYFIRI